MNSDGYLFEKNLYSYCKNCPIIHTDPDGASATYFEDGSDGQINTWMPDDMALGGGGTWGALMRTLQSARNGLNMAMGKRDMSRLEKHHVLSIYREKQYAQYIDRYGLKLDSEINIVDLPGHRGRHTDYYHNLMEKCLAIVNQEANGDKDLFYEGFKIIYNYVKDHPWLPYAK